MSKMKQLFTTVRVWILLAFVLLSLVAISPQFSSEGVAIRQVQKDSAAELAGIESPGASGSPTSRERVLEVNGERVTDVASYYELIEGYPPNATITIETTKEFYRLTTQAIEQYNATSNETVVIGTEDIGLTVYEAPRNNLRLGLDLSGGTRVILAPEEKVSADDLELIISNIRERLNVYGLSDIIVRDAKDLSGNDFIIVEIAGVNKDEVRELLASQGKFEAKIGNNTVFRGGNDITSVCRTADCSGIDRQAGCGQTTGGYACRFSFSITLSPSAAERQADLTRNLTVVDEGNGPYLSESLQLYLDDALVDELQIDSSLRGRAVTNIQISGSGFGVTQQSAAEDAIANMKTLQTILTTGSLPVKLEIVKSDGISPVLGKEFISNAILLAILSILAVAIVVVVRYRKPIVSVPIVITMVSEIVIILGFASAVGWNLDLAAIAAIIIAIGSGVDDQIVIIDETIHGRKESSSSWKQRIKAAFFIIFAAYFTLVAAMVPLFFAGAGLLRGFAITTLVGVTAGVLITRPAFAKLIEILLKKESEE